MPPPLARYCVSGHAETKPGVSVHAALPEFADAFPFERFNAMQAETLPALCETDDNVVVSAPTASGKTAIAEVAICQTLAAGGTALFIAPMRALTNEKEAEWDRFEELGYDVYVVTGERDLSPRRAERADILVMTPEKADSATRKHDSPRYSFVTDVDCCVIDEVHLLDSDRRGSVLEVTISRLRRLCDPRIVALSATMRNVEDVAAWLDAPSAATFEFGDEYRPVPLNADVKTYTHGDNAFADKYRRLYRTLDLVEPHVRDDGQALVFVSSRQDTVQAAKKTRDELAQRDVPIGARGDYDLHTEAQQLTNDTLRQSVLDGVGFHHAGLSKADKDRVEEWFREGVIDLLFSTSTLAWGVNLPARCVVIRDTKLHDPLEGEVDMSPLDVLQMLGRAGRPGYDDTGYAWVVCDGADADRYRRLLRDGTDIESRLAEDLLTHLNAEIALGTLRERDDVMAWLETTFYYQRATSAPEQYAADGDLRDQVSDALDELVAAGFVEREGTMLEPTTLGTLASNYYLRLETARRFAAVAEAAAAATDDEGGHALDETALLAAVATAAEFDSVSARSDEEDAVEAVLGTSAISTRSLRDDERDVELDPGERKVLAILKAATRGSTPSALQSDAWVIRQNAQRLLAALRAFLDELVGAEAANLAARLAARVEHGVDADAVGLTAVDGVGPGRARNLAQQGFQTPADIVNAGVDQLRHADLSEGVAERIVENARNCPAVTIEWGELPDSIGQGERSLHEVTVRSTAGGARAGVRVTLNGHEMTAKSPYLGEATVPVVLFGGDTDELTVAVRVAFPDVPISPVVETRTIHVE